MTFFSGSELPPDWELLPISEVAEVNPKFDKRGIANDLEITFIPMPAVEAETGYIDVSGVRCFGEVKKGYTGFLEADVLFAKITPCMENGKMAVVPALKNGVGFGSTEFHVLRPGMNLEPKFLYFYVSSKQVRFDAEHNMSGAVGQKRVPAAYLSGYSIPVPPVEQQKRIVAKIEELFSELDNGIAALKTAREQLKVYRQAVLKHAFEGKLTVQWREENADKLESSEQLLARIQREREARYQQQLEEWKAAVKTWKLGGEGGKRPTKPRALARIASPDEEEVKNYCALPPNWKWIKLGQITWSVKDGPHFSPQYSSSGIPFITGGNVKPSGVDFKNVKFISRELHEELSKRCKPELGDILYTKGGTTGIARVNTYNIEFNVWVHVAILKLTKSMVPFYLQHALNSPSCYAQSQEYTHGVGNQDLGLTRMVNIILPLCCEEEQEAIVQKMDRLNVQMDLIQETIDKELIRCETLRQSILKKAFSGQLVLQDPSVEPANELLDRITAEEQKGEQMGRASAHLQGPSLQETT